MKLIKVTHIISGLSTGGAEMMLYKLASHYAQSGTLMEHNIISLTDAKGYLTDRIQSLGIPVVSLGLELKNPLSFSGLLRMAHLLRRIKPDLIQGWMYHGNLISATASRLIAKNKPLVWNIRHSLDDIRTEKYTTRIVIF